MIIKHRQIPRTSAADSILWLIKRLKERLRAFHCDALLCNQRSSSSSAPTLQGFGALAGRSIREWLHGAILLAAAPLRINRLTLTRSKLSNAWSRGGGSQGLVTQAHWCKNTDFCGIFTTVFSLCRGLRSGVLMVRPSESSDCFTCTFLVRSAGDPSLELAMNFFENFVDEHREGAVGREETRITCHYSLQLVQISAPSERGEGGREGGGRGRREEGEGGRGRERDVYGCLGYGIPSSSSVSASEAAHVLYGLLNASSFKAVPLTQNVRARACFRPSQAH